MIFHFRRPSSYAALALVAIAPFAPANYSPPASTLPPRRRALRRARADSRRKTDAGLLRRLPLFPLPETALARAFPKNQGGRVQRRGNLCRLECPRDRGADGP